MAIDPKRVLTPEGRTIFEFVQLLIYVVTGAIVVYHFVVSHGAPDAIAATPPQNQRRLERKIDITANAVNDLRQDLTAVMDRLEIPQDKRATGRHALPTDPDVTTP